MVHIYWGLGKGKTSTLNGSAIRAKGAGFKVAIFRFLKGRQTHEDNLIRKLQIPVISLHSSPKFVIEMNEEEKKQAVEDVKETMNKILEMKETLDMILLDEFIDLATKNVGILTEKEIIDFIDKIKLNKEILISGHTKLESFFKKVDLITEYTPTKHYFEKGIKARKGIEF